VRAAHCKAVRTRIPENLRLLLALLLTLNAALSAAAPVATGMTPGDAAPAGHHGHEGMAGMDRDGPAPGQHAGDCCDEMPADCDCRCALSQPAALRIALSSSGHATAPPAATPETARRPSTTITTPFRPPA